MTEIQTPLPKQETPWDMTTKEQEKAKWQAILCSVIAALIVIAMILQSKAGI